MGALPIKILSLNPSKKIDEEYGADSYGGSNFDWSVSPLTQAEVRMRELKSAAAEWQELLKNDKAPTKRALWERGGTGRKSEGLPNKASGEESPSFDVIGGHVKGLGIIAVDLSDPVQAKTTLIHELQHEVQDIEEFTGGSSPDAWDGTKQERFQNYYYTAGEVEARLASEPSPRGRLDMTEEERQASYPLDSAPGVVYAEDAPHAAGASFYITKDNDGEPIAIIKNMQGLFIGVPEAEYTKIAESVIREKFKGQTLPLSEYDLAKVTNKSAGEYTHPSKGVKSDLYAVKMRAATELDNLLEGSEFMYHAKDTKNHNIAKDGWDYYRTRFILDGQVFEGQINIAVSDKGKTFYDITKVKRVANYSKYSRPLLESTSVSVGNSDGDSISQSDSAVNNSVRKSGGNDTEGLPESADDLASGGRASVSRSRKDKAQAALAKYKESGDVLDLPEAPWVKSYHRDAERNRT